MLDILLLTYPIWWALGVGYFIWPLLTLPLLISLLARRDVRFPRGFSLWICFLGWMILSVVEVGQAHRLIAFGYRAAIYVSVTVIFVYLYNMPPGRLSAGRIVHVLTLFWCFCVLGGLVGVLFPTAGFSTPAQALVPGSLLSDQTILYYVHPFFSEVSTYFGYTVYRPKVLFAYTNQWGGCVTLLTPFVFASLAAHRRGGFRWLLIALLALSVIPIIFSLDRGAWLGLAVGGTYVVGRVLAHASLRRLIIMIVLGLTVALGIAISPLGGLIGSRLTSNQNSNSTRSNVYVQAFDDTLQSPLLGHGSPQPDPTAPVTNPNLPHVGTQGQYPLVMFSNGFPGLLAFVGWFLYVAIRTRRVRAGPVFWAHVALVIAIVEMPYYDFMPASLHLAMIAAALALRELPLSSGKARTTAMENSLKLATAVPR